MEFLWVLLGILALALDWWLASVFEEIAKEKGYEGKRYFWLPFLFSAAGWAVVIALPDKRLHIELSNIERRLDNIEKTLSKRDRDPEPERRIEPPEQPAPVAPPVAQASEEERVLTKESGDEDAAGPVTPRKLTPRQGERAEKVVCPKCGQVQPTGRTRCWRCGVAFAE
ncbi:MAG: hypothetical protein IK095_00965 [Oscillospiraceae bacterium]|nr:hypothetical protein [Oscillospiraceae bacterium]